MVKTIGNFTIINVNDVRYAIFIMEDILIIIGIQLDALGIASSAVSSKTSELHLALLSFATSLMVLFNNVVKLIGKF